MRAGCHVAVCLWMGLSACSRPPGDARASVGTSASAPDTVVRRVARVSRTASAMQRVTRDFAVLRALEPLDSLLAVRVMDQRGAELAGVHVSWTLRDAGDGAQLRVINARTNAGGVSRVAFTPGRTAMPQLVVAEVSGVGHIAFPVSVPVARIHLVGERDVWAGDGTVVAADLRDAANVELHGGPLAWGTTDSTVLRVASADRASARVTGRLPGTADVVAWIEPGTVRGHLRVAVRPVLSGAFVTADGGPLPPMAVEVRVGGARDSIESLDGRFGKRIRFSSPTEVELRADPLGSNAYHPLRLGFGSERAMHDMRIALVPTSWHIQGGSYEGQVVSIDAASALRRPAGSAPFWRLAPIRGRAPAQILGWPAPALPLRIAFNRGRSIHPIAAADSVAFWRIARQMEADLGGPFFTPAQLSGDSVPVGVVTVEIARDVSAGHTFVAWNEGGDAYDGTLMFRSAATLRDAHIVTHELLHLLGFGHATSFRSVSVAAGGTEPRLTPEDVAYVQLALRLRDLQVRAGARAGLPPPPP